MSKGLKAFARIKSYFKPKQLLTKEKTLDDLDTIEKELKALEIIIKKNVNIKDVKRSIEAEKRENDIQTFPAVGFYNRGQYHEENWLTDSEFEIVREIIL